jgi:MerR family transcriptional regulator, heat shock protein HspR
MSYYQRETRAVYVISVAAELAGMHAQTLRMYEKKGLVMPGRSPGGDRRYSEMDLARLRRIQELTNSGLNLEGVRRVIALEEENARLRAEIESLRTETEQLHRQYRREIVPFKQFNVWTGKRSS